MAENNSPISELAKVSAALRQILRHCDIGLGGLYSEQAVQNGMTTRKVDLVFASLTYKIMHEFQIPLYEQMRERDKSFYEALEKVGFMTGATMVRACS